jgi:hypothetical protein
MPDLEWVWPAPDMVGPAAIRGMVVEALDPILQGLDGPLHRVAPLRLAGVMAKPSPSAGQRISWTAVSVDGLEAIYAQAA